MTPACKTGRGRLAEGHDVAACLHGDHETSLLATRGPACCAHRIDRSSRMAFDERPNADLATQPALMAGV